MTTMALTLPDLVLGWIEEQVRCGREVCVSDYLEEFARRERIRRMRTRMEELLTSGLRREELVQATPEYWERKRVELSGGRSTHPSDPAR